VWSKKEFEPAGSILCIKRNIAEYSYAKMNLTENNVRDHGYAKIMVVLM